MAALRTLARWLARGLAIGVAAAIVALVAYRWLGPPRAARVDDIDELARFAPTVGHGLGQFVGETLLSVLVVWVARRWLRVRL